MLGHFCKLLSSTHNKHTHLYPSVSLSCSSLLCNGAATAATVAAVAAAQTGLTGLLACLSTCLLACLCVCWLISAPVACLLDCLRTMKRSLSSDGGKDSDDGDGKKSVPPGLKHGGHIGLTSHFPSILHLILARADDEGYSHIISWQSHGRSFMVHDRERLVTDVMPLYFRQTRFASFQRQLNLYGFIRIATKGPDYGGYYHLSFLRGRPDLCENIQRLKSDDPKPKKSAKRNLDFYTLPPMPLTNEADKRHYASASQAQAHANLDIDLSLMEPDPIAPNFTRDDTKADMLREAQRSLFSLFNSASAPGTNMPDTATSHLPLDDALVASRRPGPMYPHNITLPYSQNQMQQQQQQRVPPTTQQYRSPHNEMDVSSRSYSYPSQYTMYAQQNEAALVSSSEIPIRRLSHPGTFVLPGNMRYKTYPDEATSKPEGEMEDARKPPAENKSPGRLKRSLSADKIESGSSQSSPSTRQGPPLEMPLSEVVRMARFLWDVEFDSECDTDNKTDVDEATTRSCP
jgi:HSF-type DNA-binding